MPDPSEIYICVDIEASGPIPGEYNMLSIGACVVDDLSKTFYRELKPISDKFDPKAMKVTGFSLEKLQQEGEEPKTVMIEFEKWIKSIAGNKIPVFVAFNASLDWMFTCYYFHKYLVRNIFGHSGVDIRAYYMGKLKTSWKATERKNIKQEFRSSRKHTHNALDDALGHAEEFRKLLEK